MGYHPSLLGKDLEEVCTIYPVYKQSDALTFLNYLPRLRSLFLKNT